MGYKVECFALPSQKSSPGIIHLESTKAEILTQEILELSSKGAITPSNGNRDGYTKPDLPCPQVRRVLVPSCQLEIPQQMGCSPSLQDGVHQDSEGVADTRGLDGEV